MKNSRPSLDKLPLFARLAHVSAVRIAMAAQKASQLAEPGWAPGDEETGRRLVSEAKMQVILQPKFDLKGGQVCGFEAFASPLLAGRRLTASEFVPSVEAACAIADFDWLVLRAGFAVAAQARADASAPVSFNVSPVTLCAPGFAKALGELATRAGVSLCGVKVEILEKMPLTSMEVARMRQEMAKARRLGFEFSIDDFATGDATCSSLSFPATEMKIDRYYVSRMDEPVARGWVQSMVKLAKNKGMKVCAEGVEHQWQLDALKKMDVDIGQGWLWAKAMAPQDAFALLTMKRPPEPPKLDVPSRLLSRRAPWDPVPPRVSAPAKRG